MVHKIHEVTVGFPTNLPFLCTDTFEMVVEEESGVIKFTVPHHYESQVKAVGEVNNASRARRLAQEAVTLSTSLPLSASSSVFVRCDEERLDVMKVGAFPSWPLAWQKSQNEGEGVESFAVKYLL